MSWEVPKMKNSLVLLMAFSIVLWVSSLQGQESDGEPSKSVDNAVDNGLVLEEVIVTADRKNSLSRDYVQAGTFRDARVLETPLTVNIITKELMDAQQAASIADATRNSPGVTSHQINSTIYSNLSIRGIPTGFTTNYRINGTLPIINRIDLPLENKERVEVLKGAAGLYYGFASPSGIVNLVSKRPDEDLLSGEVRVNSHGGFGGSIDASRRWESHGLRFNAAAASIETGIDKTSGDRYFASLAYDWEPTDRFRLELDGEYIDKSVTEPTLIVLSAPVDGEITLPPLQDSSHNLGFNWLKAEADAYNLVATARYKLSPAWSVKFTAGHAYLDALRRFSSFSGYDLTSGDGTVRVFTFPKNTLERDFYRGDVSGVFRTGPIEHLIVAGYSYDSLDIQTPRAVAQGSIVQNYFNPTAELPALPEPPLTVQNLSTTKDGGAFVTDRISFTDWLEVTGGVRFVDYSNQSFTSDVDVSPTNYSASVLIKPSSTLSLYSSYIEGLEEGGIAPGISNNAGEILPAAISVQWEAGVKWEPQSGLLLTAAYFNIDRVTSFLNSDNFFVQAGSAIYKGIELNITGELSDRLSVAAGGTYIDAKQKKGSAALIGNRIEGTPEFTGSLFVQYALEGIPGLSLNGSVFYIGDRPVNAANNAFASGYTLIDLGVSYSVESLDWPLLLRLNARNVFDKEYWEAASSGLVQQGPPGVISFTVSTSF